MQHFAENVKRWGHDFPEVKTNEWEVCETGNQKQRNLKKGETYLHSSHNAVLEARQWFNHQQIRNNKWLVVYGSGLGYHLEPIKEWLSQKPSHRLIVIEDNPEILKHFFESPICSELLQNPQVEIVYFDKTKFSDTIKELVQRLTFQDVIVLLSPYNQEFRPLESSDFQFHVMNEKYTQEIWMWEYLDKGSTFLQNFYQNLFHIPDSYSGNKLINQFKGIPAIICGAGPSLNKNHEVLRSLHNRAIIFAGGTAMNSLNGFNITPHFGAGIDPFPAQYTRLIMNTAYEVPYFYRSRINKESVDTIHGDKLYLTGTTGYPIAEWFDKELGLGEQFIHEGANVINFTLSLAYLMGCNPIICVGVDLAYSEGKSYAEGVVNHPIHDPKEHFITKTNRDELLLHKDIRGEPIYTVWKWIIESMWYTQFAQTNKDVLIFNSTEGGLGFDHIPNIPLSEAANLFLTQEYDLEGIIHQSIQNAEFSKDVNSNKVLEVVIRLLESLNRCVKILEEVYLVDPAAWNQETGESENPAIQELVKKLKSEIAYTALIQSFDESYIKFMKVAKSEEQTPSDILKILSSRFPFLMEFIINNLTYIRTAIESQRRRDEVSKDVSKIETGYRVEGDRFFVEGYEEKLYEEPFDNHTGTGRFEFKYPNDQTKSVFYYHQALLHGPSRCYNEAGVLLSETWHVNGNQEGKALFYGNQGQLLTVLNYKDGLKEGVQTYYYKGGQLKSEIEYKKGLLDGVVRLYHPNGQPKRELHFKNGLREGFEKMWNSQGILTIESEYKDNRAVNVTTIHSDKGVLAKKIYFDSAGQRFRVERYNERGEQLPEITGEFDDFFDVVTKRTDKFTHAIEGLCGEVEKTLSVYTNSHPESNLVGVADQLKDLDVQMQKLSELNEKLIQESGINRDAGQEPIWKSPSAKDLLKSNLDVMVNHMQKTLLEMNHEFEKLQNVIKENEKTDGPV